MSFGLVSAGNVLVNSKGAIDALARLEIQEGLNINCYMVAEEMGLYDPAKKFSVLLYPGDYFSYEDGEIVFHRNNETNQEPYYAYVVEHAYFKNNKNKAGEISATQIEKSRHNLADFTAETGVEIEDLGLDFLIKKKESLYTLQAEDEVREKKITTKVEEPQEEKEEEVAHFLKHQEVTSPIEVEEKREDENLRPLTIPNNIRKNIIRICDGATAQKFTEAIIPRIQETNLVFNGRDGEYHYAVFPQETSKKEQQVVVIYNATTQDMALGTYNEVIKLKEATFTKKERRSAQKIILALLK
ncbi:hypothetical protein H6776_02575 [Candidatus Nomurabacteria bacterium]|nr:hypothetical protein [Candidatus Nomurabacteria bacterium]